MVGDHEPGSRDAASLTVHRTWSKQSADGLLDSLSAFSGRYTFYDGRIDRPVVDSHEVVDGPCVLT